MAQSSHRKSWDGADHPCWKQLLPVTGDQCCEDQLEDTQSPYTNGNCRVLIICGNTVLNTYRAYIIFLMFPKCGIWSKPREACVRAQCIDSLIRLPSLSVRYPSSPLKEAERTDLGFEKYFWAIWYHYDRNRVGYLYYNWKVCSKLKPHLHVWK